MPNSEFDDPAFLARLRAGDHAAFRLLIRRLHNTLVGVATSVIGSRAQGEEVVQDAWLAVFSGIGGFEGRSSLITWVFSIVLNRARTRARREGRLVGLPALDDGQADGGNERAVPLSEFKPDGHWREAPRWWDELNPERIVAGRQLWDHVQDAVEHLPPGQRAVIVLRDMENRSAEEACALLSISPENQRVLLHRARGRIRRILDSLLAGEGRNASAGLRQGDANRRAIAPVVRMLALGRAWLTGAWRSPAACGSASVESPLVPGGGICIGTNGIVRRLL